VGAAVARRLASDGGGDAAVRAVAVRRPTLERDCPLPGRVVDDALAVVEADDVDVVVEVMGPVEASRAAVERALALGKPVVTANKALLAAHGPALRALAAAAGVELSFEAAVAAGVPVLRSLAALAAGDRVNRVEGVLNGTVTFVLRQLEGGASFEDAVLAAKTAGYAEADASRDLSGLDAADKIAVLSQVAFGDTTTADDVHVMGIDWLESADIDRAARRGQCWRLVAMAVRGGCRRVEPVLLDVSHPFSRLAGADNAVSITTERTGTVTLTGPGAGGEATATAVVADVLAITRASGRRQSVGVRRS
jgi:homoserine dehydrogenase